MRKALSSLILLALLGGTSRAARADPVAWTSVGRRSQVTLHVLKKGLFSGMAHDHHFVPDDWRARVTLDEAAPQAVEVDLVIATGSLRDNQPELSPEDRDKVNRQAVSREVLDAARYPEIRFTAKKLEPRSAGADGGAETASAAKRADGEVEGVLIGTLSLHGRERPLSVPVHATREEGAWRARGTVAFKQSEFGIHPYSGFLGTVAVHDEVKLEYDVVLARAR